MLACSRYGDLCADSLTIDLTIGDAASETTVGSVVVATRAVKETAIESIWISAFGTC